MRETIMGRKIFVSYKYADSDVPPLNNTTNAQYGGLLGLLAVTTVRNYVDLIESYFDSTNHIYKGESDNEDLSQLSENTIWEKLKDRIYDSTVTIVMISKGMRESNRRDKSQWIPWEISFSLKEQTRKDKTSHSNAMLAVVLPDRNNSYNYFMTPIQYGGYQYNTNILFDILKKNMFNEKNPDIRNGLTYGDNHSYIEPVKWSDFSLYPNTYIDKAVRRQQYINTYNITKEV
jgi:hypothetical protein